MKLNDENIINALREAHIFKNQNNYFYGKVIPNNNTILGYIINYTEEGIGIIPVSKMDKKPVTQNVLFITLNNLKRVNVTKAGFLKFKNIEIITNNDESILINVSKNISSIKNYKDNLERFLSIYDR